MELTASTRAYINPEPHFCVHCQNFIIDIPYYRWYGGKLTAFPHIKTEEVLRGAKEGCLFYSFLKRLIQQHPRDGCFIFDKLREMANGPWQTNELEMDRRRMYVIRLAAWARGRWLQASFSKRFELDLQRPKANGPSIVEFSRTAYEERMSLFCFAHADDPAAQAMPDRPVNQDLASDYAFELASRWLKECQSFHRACSSQSAATFAPTRLLCLMSKSGTECLYLHDSVYDDNPVYSALSYCWGGDQPFKTTRATLAINREAIDISSLPRTIQDAIIVTRKLGLRYLWVDSLCIIQDDRRDKGREIPRIRDTFMRSFVTISASSAASCMEGFLHPRKIFSMQTSFFQIRFYGPNRKLGYILLARRADVPEHLFGEEDSPIHHRAWTLEERHLSPRILEYGVRQLQWVCRSAKTFDGGDYYYRNVRSRLWSPMHSLLARSISQFETWTEIVEDYSGRDMTDPNDRLVAISGLEQEYHDSFGDDYLAGLWRSDLPRYLLWRVKRPTSRPAPAHYLAPTWSWASVETGVEWSGVDIPWILPPHFSVLDCRTEPLIRGAPFAAVKSGYLTLRCRIKMATEAVWERSPNSGNLWSSNLRFNVDGSRLGCKGWEVHFDIPPEEIFHQASDPQTSVPQSSLWFVEMDAMSTAYRFLVLRQSNDRTFSRIGMIYTHDKRLLNCFAAVEPQVITMV